MNRKILALNVALLVLLGTLGWMLRAHWRFSLTRYVRDAARNDGRR